MTAHVKKLLWTSFALSLGASVSHLAYAFSSLEFDGDLFAGWAAAVAIDAGMVALSSLMESRRKARRSAKTFRHGLWIFAAISFFGNMIHALSVAYGPGIVIPWVWRDLFTFGKSLILSGSLPVLNIYLGEMLSVSVAVHEAKPEGAGGGGFIRGGGLAPGGKGEGEASTDPGNGKPANAFLRVGQWARRYAMMRLFNLILPSRAF